jgi:DNA-binding NarL/FixJ family response regulator
VLGTDTAQADAVLAKAQQQAEQALREVRRSVTALRERQPSVPLPDALRALADEASAAGVPTELGVTGPTRPLAAEAEESLFRAAQEGLTNIRKHAQATRAQVMLDYSQPAAVRLEIHDDGAGVTADGQARGASGFRADRCPRARGAAGWPDELGVRAGPRIDAAGGGTRMNAPVRVLLADDQALFREALATLLGVRADIEVVGEAANGDEALTRAAELKPDVVLMDLRMPVLDGIAATRRMRVEQPKIRVIALTTFDDDEEVFAALRAGAVGYLLKDVSSARLVEAVLAAARDESVLQPSIAAKVVARIAQLPDPDPQPRQQPLVVPLSDRELDVVRLLSQGRSNREIAAALFLAEGTVKNHVTNVLGKLGARDRTQAALRARALGLL